MGYQTSELAKWHLKKEPSGFDYIVFGPAPGKNIGNSSLKHKEMGD